MDAKRLGRRGALAPAACVLALVSGCVLAPVQGETCDEEDSFNFSGGSPWGGAPVGIQCRDPSTPSQWFALEWFRAPTTLDPIYTEVFGDYYVVQRTVALPRYCWDRTGMAQLRFLNWAPDGTRFGMLTFDDAGYDCLRRRPLPYDGEDYRRCSMDDDGLLTVCRRGTRWTGTACK